MIKFLLTTFVIIVGLRTFAQFDLEIAITNIDEWDEFDSGATLGVDIELTNWGDVLPMGDTLYLGWNLDGVFYGPNTGVLEGAGVAGGGVSFPIDGATSFTGLEDGVHTLCAWIIGVGSVELGQNFDISGISHLEAIGDVTIDDIATGDPTPANNEYCVTFIVGDTSTVIDDVSIHEDEAGQFRIYPNPVRDVLTINTADQGGVITVFDLSGKTILTENMMGTTNFDLSGLLAGVYLLEIRTTEGILLKNEKLIVQH